MNPPLEQMLDGVTRGDCLDVMKEMPAQSVDLILTDPPYLYLDRSGRSVRNDNNDAWIDPAFAQISLPGCDPPVPRHRPSRMKRRPSGDQRGYRSVWGSFVSWRYSVPS